MEKRDEWHQEARKVLDGVDLVFLDPDNGLLVNSVGRKSAKSALPRAARIVYNCANMVNEHLGGDVYVRAFLFGLPDSCTRNLGTGLAGEWIASAEALVVALDDFQLRTICRKGGKVYGLTHLGGGFCGVVVDSRRFLHSAPKRQGPDLSPALHRIAEAQR